MRTEPIALAEQPEEYVLGPDEAVIEETRFFLRERQDPPCPLGESFEHDPKDTARVMWSPLTGEPAACPVRSWR